MTSQDPPSQPEEHKFPPMDVPVEDPYFVKPALSEPLRRAWSSRPYPGAQAVPRDTPHLRRIFDKVDSEHRIVKVEYHAGSPTYLPAEEPELPNDWPYSRQRYAGDARLGVVRQPTPLLTSADPAHAADRSTFPPVPLPVALPGAPRDVAARLDVVPAAEAPITAGWWIALALVGLTALALLATPY